MYHIHGLSISSNTTKTIYVAEELGVDYQYVSMDMSKGEHKTPEHMARHPLGKLPTLTHNGESIFESGAICRYMASAENSSMYPATGNIERARVDQWMDFFTCHLGRWLNSFAFEKVAKVKFGFGEPNPAAIEEAEEFIQQQMPAVEAHLGHGEFFLGDHLSIADPFAFAYMEMAEMGEVALSDYANVSRWYEDYKARESVGRAKKTLGFA